MNRSVIIAAAALVAAGCATTTEEAEAPVAYTVLKEDASVPFASKSIRGFRVGAGRVLLLEANGGRWYRATLQSTCQSDLPWEHAIGVDGGAIDRVDRFATVIVDGRRCQIETFDEVADPDAKPETAPPPAS